MSDMVDVPWMKDVKVGSTVRYTADGERKEFCGASQTLCGDWQ